MTPAPQPRLCHGLTDAADLPPPVHLAIGIFDGVHLGHQSVLEAAVHQASREGGTPAVLTFDPHPSRLFRPAEATRLIVPLEEKVRLLGDLGIHAVIVQPFTAAFAALSAEAFLDAITAALPTLGGIYVGQNFRFGKGRTGTIDTLVEHFRPHNTPVFSMRRLQRDGEAVSSTRIRALLENGRIEEANNLLGRNYAVTGVTVKGRQLGRTIGFPTLNLPWSPELIPRFGVYAVRAKRETDAAWHKGVANYGLRPTVTGGDAEPLLEVHLFEPTDWPYGTGVTVEWLHFIRPEKTFADLDALKAQIRSDRTTAAASLEGKQCLGHDLNLPS